MTARDDKNCGECGAAPEHDCPLQFLRKHCPRNRVEALPMGDPHPCDMTPEERERFFTPSHALPNDEKIYTKEDAEKLCEIAVAAARTGWQLQQIREGKGNVGAFPSTKRQFYCAGDGCKEQCAGCKWSDEAPSGARGEQIKSAHQYRDACNDVRIAIRYADDSEEDRPSTELEKALFASSAIGQKAKEYRGHGLTPEMVKAHYPQTQHQPDECQICAEVFEVAAEALAMHSPDGGKQA